jgi:NADH-quinone oxidoreductase subunit M
MYKRVIFGAIANARVAKLTDLGKREFVLLGAMAVLVLAIGVYPKPFTDAISPSSATLLAQTNRSVQPVEAASIESGERLQARAAVVVNPAHAPG